MHKDIQKLSLAGLLISLGIIYGDIGTSPLYVFKAIVGGQQISETLILGGISCIFWTLTMQTTIKYVSITLQADNKGEGGIFSLFSLVRRKATPLLARRTAGASLFDRLFALQILGDDRAIAATYLAGKCAHRRAPVC